MKQSLQLKTSQQLRLTPQLQQAIRFLQLSTAELQQELQEALESNPLLEIEPTDTSPANENLSDTPSESSLDQAREPIDFERQTFEQEQPSGHEDYRISASSQSQSNTTWEDNFDTNHHAETLQDHLRWQLNLSHLTERDRVIGEYIIDAVQENGRLSIEPQQIFESIELEEPDDIEPLEFDEFEVVRHFIQQLNPIGCASFSLEECLNAQIQRQHYSADVYNAIQKIISEHLNLLSSDDHKKISRLTHIREPHLSAAIDVIRQLNPYPGEGMGASTTNYIVPDIIMHKEKDRWVIRLNAENRLNLQLNDHYVKILGDSNTPQAKEYLKDYLQQAKTLIQSLDTRNQTLLNVGSCIVNIQQDFFEDGPSAMVPLTQKQLAGDLDLHESTISRVTTQKYILTPRGVFELKYFFSAQLGSDADSHSSTAVQSMIRDLVKNESPAKPLSDAKIAKHLLENSGVEIARRTVAKYREILSIPTYNERKRII